MTPKSKLFYATFFEFCSINDFFLRKEQDKKLNSKVNKSKDDEPGVGEKIIGEENIEKGNVSVIILGIIILAHQMRRRRTTKACLTQFFSI